MAMTMACCLSCNICAQVRLIQAIDGAAGCRGYCFIGNAPACNLLAPTMTRRVFIGAGLPCLASRPLLCRQVRWTFLLICTWAFLGWCHSHFLRTLFWPVCDVAFKGSPDFVNLSRDSFRIWPKDIFAVWHGLAVNFLPICTFLGDECYKYAANVLSHH